MTGTQAGDFVAQIAEAYQALKALPDLQRQIADMEVERHADGDKIVDLELRMHEKQEQLNAANDRIRSLEVERDDAQFQVLSLEERLNYIARVLGSVIDTAADARATATVTKPEPEAPAVNTEVVNQGHSETSASMVLDPHKEIGIQEPHADPFATSSDGSQSPSAPTPSAEPNPPVIGPYAGKMYRDHPAYVSYSAWLDGGGTDYGYHYLGNAIDADKSRL